MTGATVASQFGELSIRENDVTSFTEKPKSSSFINSGFFVFNKEIFNYLTNDDKYDLEYGTLEKLSQEGQIKVYKHKGFWACMDTFRDMEYLNKLWNEGKAEWKIW